ncbi:DEKNAAC101705 [Brettanomyces naardenensis]|uniref:Origin recognition complex subunit 2 n=1 Tax=Brettanomyces naardenensis TaxID=13370 RepID=A0A448YIU0_BRENA|nr:DEKNAAC101705 [Brettanomyces naardenensis]
MALQVQFKSMDSSEYGDELTDDKDLIEDEDKALADKIIALSKKDGLEPMHLERDDSAEDDLDEEQCNSFSHYLPSPNIRNGSPKRKGRKSLQPRFEDLKITTPVKLLKVSSVDTEQDSLLRDDAAESKSLFYDGYEGFFEQQKLKIRKSSTNSMTMAPQISYDDFHRFNKLLDLFCPLQIHNLIAYYRQQYTQWLFELEEGFSLVFYGVGSKRQLLLDFVRNFLVDRLPKNTKCIVANGYNLELHPRILLKTIWKVVFNKGPPAWHMVDSVRELKEEFNRYVDRKRLVILLHNIDGESLRQDKYHYILSGLSSIAQIHFVCSMDNLNTPLFWNSSMMSSFNFIWHNVTTFKPYTTEISFKDPLNIGKSNEFVGSQGAKYVLSSLTSNAKNLYRNLLIRQLEKIDSAIEQDAENRGLIKGNIKMSILFREFYDFCVGEFITSNEISFRTVLREFVEHKMCNLTRNTAGTEVLYIPFTVDEMEKILEEELLE